MKVYLAHNFEAREYLKTEIVPLLLEKGHTVTSRWITFQHWDKREDAVMDLTDLEASSTLIFFVDNFGERPGKGKFVELGFAIRAGIRCILVGEDDSCVFYHLPNMRRVGNIQEALALI